MNTLHGIDKVVAYLQNAGAEATDTTGRTIRVFSSEGNVARTNRGAIHTTKVFPKGKGGKSMEALGFKTGGKSLRVGSSSWDESKHPRDEAGKFA